MTTKQGDSAASKLRGRLSLEWLPGRKGRCLPFYGAPGGPLVFGRGLHDLRSACPSL